MGTELSNDFLPSKKRKMQIKLQLMKVNDRPIESNRSKQTNCVDLIDLSRQYSQVGIN